MMRCLDTFGVCRFTISRTFFQWLVCVVWTLSKYGYLAATSDITRFSISVFKARKCSLTAGEDCHFHYSLGTWWHLCLIQATSVIMCMTATLCLAGWLPSWVSKGHQVWRCRSLGGRMGRIWREGRWFNWHIWAWTQDPSASLGRCWLNIVLFLKYGLWGKCFCRRSCEIYANFLAQHQIHLII